LRGFLFRVTPRSHEKCPEFDECNDSEAHGGNYILLQERERERKWSVPLGHSAIAIQRDLRDRNSADNNARFQPFGAERGAEYFIQELAVLQPNILGDRACIVLRIKHVPCKRIALFFQPNNPGRWCLFPINCHLIIAASILPMS